MKIFIDFDDVLFNTKNFVKDIKKIFYKFGISEKLFYETYKNRDVNPEKAGKHLHTYDPHLQFEKIRNKLGIDTKPLEKEFENFTKNTGKYIFKDARAFLKNKNKKDLFIISFGTNKFQKKKIKNSGITKHFSKIIILGQKTKSQAIRKTLGEKKIKSQEPLYFLDDRVQFLEEVKNKQPFVKTFLVHRKEGRFEDKITKCCDWKVRDLREAQKIIKKLGQ
jgi:FMN phosphatase YigB (HAD superfamily)